MLRSITIRGYRSLRELRLVPAPVTVISGGNGVGKSNVYRALALLQRLAEGRFAEALAQEGGMPSVLWAGELRKNETKRISWKLEHEDFEYSMECGLIPQEPGSRTVFKTDPDIKEETLKFSGKIMARRKGPSLEARNPGGKMETSPLPFHAPESMLGELSDAARFPAMAAARQILLAWRFYHQFRSDADSPLRRAQLGCWSPVLAHDGANLAATLQTIIESGREEILREAIASAFPDTDWSPMDENGGFQLCLYPANLIRRNYPMARCVFSALPPRSFPRIRHRFSFSMNRKQAFTPVSSPRFPNSSPRRRKKRKSSSSPTAPLWRIPCWKPVTPKRSNSFPTREKRGQKSLRVKESGGRGVLSKIELL